MLHACPASALLVGTPAWCQMGLTHAHRSSWSSPLAQGANGSSGTAAAPAGAGTTYLADSAKVWGAAPAAGSAGAEAEVKYKPLQDFFGYEELKGGCCRVLLSTTAGRGAGGWQEGVLLGTGLLFTKSGHGAGRAGGGLSEEARLPAL